MFIILKAFIDLAVHVDGSIGDDSDWALDVHHVALMTLGGLDDHASRNAEFTIHPGVHDGSAIHFHAHAAYIAVAFIALGFQLQRRTVDVAGSKFETALSGAFAADHKGDHCGVHATDEVFSTLFQLECNGLLQLGESGGKQSICDLSAGSKARICLIQKTQEVRNVFIHRILLPFCK